VENNCFYIILAEYGSSLPTIRLVKLTATDTSSVTGVILAGGRGRRMHGRDKGLITYNGNPLIEYVIAVLLPQVDELLINANRNIEAYKQYGYPVIPDELPGYPGPLAGMLACLEKAAHDHVVFVPCDTPDLPDNLVEQLLHTMQETGFRACYVHDGQRAQPVTALLHNSVQISLAQYLACGDNKVMDWMQQIDATPVDFSNSMEAFVNINSPADLE